MGAEISNILKIGENDSGYRFGVGTVNGRWVGFAVGDLGEGREGLFFLPGFTANFQFGMADRERAIKLVGAVVQDAEQGYGGIQRWWVPESLRGMPDDFRCANCQMVACSGVCLEYAETD